MPAAMGDKPSRSRVDKGSGCDWEMPGAAAADGSLIVPHMGRPSRGRAQYWDTWQIGTRCRMAGRFEPVAHCLARVGRVIVRKTHI